MNKLTRIVIALAFVSTFGLAEASAAKGGHVAPKRHITPNAVATAASITLSGGGNTGAADANGTYTKVLTGTVTVPKGWSVSSVTLYGPLSAGPPSNAPVTKVGSDNYYDYYTCRGTITFGMPGTYDYYGTVTVTPPGGQAQTLTSNSVTVTAP